MFGRIFSRVNYTLFLAIVIFAIVSISRVQHANAAINPQINFQGKLTNTDGTNVTNGTYSIVFSIYTVSSGGSNIWTETQGSVSVTDGIFRVSLGSVTALPGSVDFNSSSLYLGIKVGADPEMTPRVQFTAAPYAFNSDKLGGIASTGYLQIGPSSVQADASTNPTIFLNKTGSGNLIQLQNTATDIFTVGNTGNLTFGQNAAKSISVAQTSTNAAGQNLTIVAGQGGAGAAANGGGDLILQGGVGGGTNGVGGDITLAAGAGSGTGVVGTVLVKNPSNSTTIFQVQNAAGSMLFSVDGTNTLVRVGPAAADATGVLLVLDTKNTTGDPTGQDGSIYYNSALAQYRCYRDGVWETCGENPIDRKWVIEDEFFSGYTNAACSTLVAATGTINWSCFNTGTVTIAYNNGTVVPTADHPGILHMTTGATSGNGFTIAAAGNTTGSMVLAANQRVVSTAAVGATIAKARLRVGLHAETTTSAQPTTGVWWEADSTTNANWRYCFGTGAAATCAASAVAVAANTFASLDIQITATGAGTSSAVFEINGTAFTVSGVTIDTATRVNPAVSCFNNTAAARECFVDYFKATGLASTRR